MAKPTKDIKKKRYFKIIAPKILNSELIGKSYVYEPAKLIGKTISINLMNITKDMNHQNINIKFKVKKLNEKKEGISEIIGYEIMPSAVRRMIRLKRDKVSDSFVCRTSDNYRIKIKPMIITMYNTSKEKRTLIIKAVKYFIYNEAKNTTFENLMNKIIKKKLQLSLKSYVKHIYPLKGAEIRVAKLETNIKTKELLEEDIKEYENIVKSSKKEKEKKKEETMGIVNETEEKKEKKKENEE